MAYSELLAERIRDHLADQRDLSEKKMFGGLAFMVAGNMAVGVSGESLMVRVGVDDYENALEEEGVAEFGKTGSPMRGWVLVSPESISSDVSLREWVDRGRSIATGLPPK